MYDARYNSKGELVTLEAGTRFELDPPEVDDESALVLTKFYTTNGEVEDTELIIKSPHLTTALREVIPHYPGIHLSAQEIVIPGLPKCLFHYRAELSAYGNSLQDEQAIKHLSLLLNHMWKVFKTQMMTYSSLMESPLGLPVKSPGLNFEHLWMVFRPGCFLYVQAVESRSVLRLKRLDRHVHDIKKLQLGWEVHGEQITYEGENFGYKNVKLYIHRYEDYRSLNQLPVYPLQYSPQSAEIRREMIARGRKFVALTGVHHKSYHGVAKALAPFRNVSQVGEEDRFPLRITPVRIRTR